MKKGRLIILLIIILFNYNCFARSGSNSSGSDWYRNPTKVLTDPREMIKPGQQLNPLNPLKLSVNNNHKSTSTFKIHDCDNICRKSCMKKSIILGLFILFNPFMFMIWVEFLKEARKEIREDWILNQRGCKFCKNYIKIYKFIIKTIKLFYYCMTKITIYIIKFMTSIQYKLKLGK